MAAMMAADVSAQECPEWLKWVCPDRVSSNPASGNHVRQEKQLSRTKATSGSETGRRTKQARGAGVDAATKSKQRQEEGPKPTGSAATARNIRSGDQSGDPRLVAHGGRQGTRADQAMNDEQEKLFQQFLEWEKERRLNANADQ
jgi:basic membrane lipoprotein Med (substrate-binding protein (PBP1-ABC) superfamily)